MACIGSFENTEIHLMTGLTEILVDASEKLKNFFYPE